MTYESASRLRHDAPLERRRLAAAVAVTTLLFGVAARPVAAHAAPPPQPAYSDVILCDPTACFIAWAVVDSDGDGVCDADEIMAGSDPYDASSRPLLKHIAELGVEHKLPSFEAGLGTFLLFPEQIVTLREKLSVDLVAAFPMNERSSALTRMGISLDTLQAYGIDVERDGLTMGLDGSKADNGLPARRVGGIDVNLISDDDNPHSAAAHGGVVSHGRNIFGDFVYVFRDGFWRKDSDEGDGKKVSTVYDADDKPRQITTSYTQTTDNPDGSSDSKSKSVTTDGSGENLDGSESEQSHKHPDGSTSRLKVTVQNVRDDKGNVTGQVVTTVYNHTSADGTKNETSKTVQKCDANGKNCTTVDGVEAQSEPKKYYDYDNLPPILTQEDVDGTLRLRGAAVNVVQGWTAPGLEEMPTDPRDPSLIMFVDSTLAESFQLIEPLRVTTAQPEYRDDLPSPRAAGPPPAGGGTGGCNGLC